MTATDFLDLDDGGLLADAHARWRAAKLRAAEAADALRAADDTLRQLLIDRAPGGATLLSGNRQVATWTRKTRTVVDTTRLYQDHPQEFLECAKPPAVDLTKFRKEYPHLVEAYSTRELAAWELRLG